MTASPHIDKLRASPTQPRKHFNQKELDDLRDSMVQHGFAFGAILARPIPGSDTFEIVIGERRTRSARAAIAVLRTWPADEEIKDRIKSLEYPPCQIRDLTDTQVIEFQLIENLQREDLNPMEEADGYYQMLRLRNGAGDPIHTIDTIATRLGRSRDVIERRILLCNLDEESRAAVTDGLLAPRTAYLIARIPDASRRVAVSKMVLHPEFKPGPLSYRDAEEEIAKHFMRDLRKAPFDQADADLVPMRQNELQVRCAGGACLDCPFKAGNLDSEVSPMRRNTCLNPMCYDEKIEAEWELWRQKETDPTKKRRALGRVESLAVFSKEFPDQPSWKSGLVNLDQHPAGDDLQAGEQSPGAWRVITAGSEMEIIVARDINGNTHELVSRELALEAAKSNGHDVFKTGDKKEKQSRKAIGLTPPADLTAEKGFSLEQTQENWLNATASKEERDSQRKKQEKERGVNEERQKTIVFACIDRIRKKAKPNTAFLRRLALFLHGSRTQTNEELLKRYKLPIADDISRNVARWKDADLVAFIVEIITTDGGYNFDLDAEDQSWFKLFGVDYAAEEKRLRPGLIYTAKSAGAGKTKAKGVKLAGAKV